MVILTFDPGESTGWICATFESGTLIDIKGGTAPSDHRRVAEIIEVNVPDVIVLESFKLYPKLAQNGTMNWNSFYPCEVIGVIKYVAQIKKIPVVQQSPSVKRFSGGIHVQMWKSVRKITDITEHTKDAFLHLRYYMRNNKDFIAYVKKSQAQ